MEDIENLNLDDLFEEFDLIQEEIEKEKEEKNEEETEQQIKLTEQNIVEMIYFLKSKGLINKQVYTTQDGISIVTKEKLIEELYEAIEQREGRIQIHDLEDIVNVDRSTIEELLKREQKKQLKEVLGSRKIVYFKKGEIITEEYINNIGIDVNRWIQNYGIIDMATITERYSLPLPYVENIVENYLVPQQWIEGKVLRDQIYTNLFLRREKKRIEMFLKGITEPLVLFHDEAMKTIEFNEQLFPTLLQELIYKDKRIKGDYIKKHNVFIPYHYENTVKDRIKEMIENNLVVEYSSIRQLRSYLSSVKPLLLKSNQYKRKDINSMSESEAFLRRSYGDELIYLSDAACTTLLCSQVDEAVKNALEQDTPLELFNMIPAQLQSSDIQILMKQCHTLHDYFNMNTSSDDNEEEEEEEEEDEQLHEEDEGYSHTLHHEYPFQLFGYGLLLPKNAIHELIDLFGKAVNGKVTQFLNEQQQQQQQQEVNKTSLALLNSKQRRKELYKRKKQRAHLKQFAKGERKKRIQHYMLKEHEIDQIIEHQWQYSYVYTGVDDISFNLRHVIETIYVPQLFYHFAYGQPKYPDVAQRLTRLKKNQPKVNRLSLKKRLEEAREHVYQRLEFYSKSIATPAFEKILIDYALTEPFLDYLYTHLGKSFLCIELALHFIQSRDIHDLDIPYFLFEDNLPNVFSDEDIDALESLLPEQLDELLASILSEDHKTFLVHLMQALDYDPPSSSFLKTHQISSIQKIPTSLQGFRALMKIITNSSLTLYAMDKKTRRNFRQHASSFILSKLVKMQETLSRATTRLTSQGVSANFDDVCQCTFLLILDYHCTQLDLYVPPFHSLSLSSSILPSVMKSLLSLSANYDVLSESILSSALHLFPSS